MSPEFQMHGIFLQSLKEVETRFNENDFKGALQILEEIERQGCHSARVEIGNILELMGDRLKALEWYQKAVDITDDMYAHLGLGPLYANGMDVGRNFEKAFFYLGRAEQLSAAQICLGLLYHRGEATKRDSEKARNYYEKATQAGYPLAMRYLASLEIEESNYLRGWFLILKSVVLATTLTMKNPRDPKLHDVVPESYLKRQARKK